MICEEFTKALLSEDDHWQQVYEEFVNSPANEVRGRGNTRWNQYLSNDENLRPIFLNRINRQPVAKIHGASYARSRNLKFTLTILPKQHN